MKKIKQFFFFTVVLLHISGLLIGCMEWDYGLENEEINLGGNGLFIINEGNFQYGNATLTYYDTSNDKVQNEVFLRANGFKLGDVAQSMTVYDGKGWIVVNNSHVVFAIDVENGREVGRIENLTSPRYIHFVSPHKAYITQLWDNRITVVDPQTYSVAGYIEVPGMTMESGSTEKMVGYGEYVFCTCWSYQNRIIKIDSRTDRVVDELTVGIQPRSLVLDKNDRLWTITDGGYDGSVYGREAPALYCIDAETFKVIRKFEFNADDTPSELQLNGSRDKLYWINDDIWCMNVAAESLPEVPFLPSRKTKYYGLTVSPYDEDVYVADAIDYKQQGKVYRYSREGRYISEFYAGINPGAFCWK